MTREKVSAGAASIFASRETRKNKGNLDDSKLEGLFRSIVIIAMRCRVDERKKEKEKKEKEIGEISV